MVNVNEQQINDVVTKHYNMLVEEYPSAEGARNFIYGAVKEVVSLISAEQEEELRIRADNSSVVEKLDAIHKFLNLSEMARELGVSRPRLYAWSSGEIPTAMNMLKINKLYTRFSFLATCGVDGIEKYANKRVFNNRSLVDFIQQGEAITWEHIEVLKVYIERDKNSSKETVV